jgi:hypothetical protein
MHTVLYHGVLSSSADWRAEIVPEPRQNCAETQDPTGSVGGNGGGDWSLNPCAEDPESTGHNLGDIAEDFTLSDQFGEDLSLDDFCESVVVLQLDVAWNGSAESSTSQLQDCGRTTGRRAWCRCPCGPRPRPATRPARETWPTWPTWPRTTP